MTKCRNTPGSASLGTASMMTMRQLICIVVCALFAQAKEAPPDTLRMVHVFFRHGSRTPEAQDTYPADPHTWETFAPHGWGQLTNRGKQAAYKLGQRLRQRYDAFLGDLYTPDVVLASSTDFDRTKMTVLLVLAGLFPPSNLQSWNATIPWMPIPYHYDKDRFDYTLRRPNKYCPAYLRELEKVLSSREVQLEIKAQRNIFNYVAKNSKKPMNKLMDIFRIYQTLNAEENMNLVLPEWTKSVYPDKIHEIAAMQCEFENYNAVLKRLNGGRMLGKVIKNMLNKSKGKLIPEKRKIFLYSGHENNVLNILAALDLFEPHIPKYTAAVIIELHYLKDLKQHAVKVYYLKDVNTQLAKQKLDGCDIVCPLDNFIQITQPHVPVNYTLECDSHVNLD